MTEPTRNATEQGAPDAYLVTFREVKINGQKRICTFASLEPFAPEIRDPHIESRELIKATPLFMRSERAEPIDSARWQAIEWRWGSGTVTLDCDEKGFFRIQVEHAEAADEYVTGEDPADVLNKLMKFDSEHTEEAALPSAEARRIDYGSMWGFMRSVLTQGAAIYQDFAAGNLKDYEEYSARVDAAARERDDELKSLPSAIAETTEDAERYRWLRIRGAALAGTEALEQGLVHRVGNLDEAIDNLRRADRSSQ